MSNSKCGTCSELARVIQRQQVEIAQLKQQIEQAATACKAVKGESNKVLTGNQPRGTWSYAKGSKETAEKILKRLSR